MSTYFQSCTCPTLPKVDDTTKLNVCHSTLPLAAKYCSSTSHPEECTSIARMKCLSSHNPLELYNYLHTISNNIKCLPPCT